MTQLLLFDTPATESFAPVAVDTEPAEPRYAQNDRLAGRSAGSAAADVYRPGVNRMGDLARLVLLRHDLVAKRRQRG